MYIMKSKSIKFLLGILGVILLISVITSCRKDLLNRPATTEISSDIFWRTIDDAQAGLLGAYGSVRGVFDRDYLFDGQGEFMYVRNPDMSRGNLIQGVAYPASAGNYSPSGGGSGFDVYYEYLYGAIIQCNNVIVNVSNMIKNAKKDQDLSLVDQLEAIEGEAKFLRAIVYFRLICLWGDVPYFTGNLKPSEIRELSRMPISQVKDSILSNLQAALSVLPDKRTADGRADKPAALSFIGKVNLYWASWNHFGWPELETFTPNEGDANSAYKAAAAAFKKVINDYGLTLWRNGDPGDPGLLGKEALIEGKADVLPNYYYLFTPVANGDPSIIMAFPHGGTGTGQGDALMRAFAGRDFEGSQNGIMPRYAIADRYQSVTTGEFLPPLIPMDPNDPQARTTPGSAVNPQSYVDRDYRMRGSIMWDYEVAMGQLNRELTDWIVFIYKTWNQKIIIGGKQYKTWNTDAITTGYAFRKFVRNTPGGNRTEGTYSWPIMRLADVYLMYAEANNMVSGPQQFAIDLVNKIRHTGNLPPLKSNKTSDKESFFKAIKQERIVELYGEGYRSFDIRRWRDLERVWGPPGGPGKAIKDTHGALYGYLYQNESERYYHQYYIYKIPQGEIDRDPNITQNKPWL